MKGIPNSLTWKMVPVADQAVLIDFGEYIDPKINKHVTELAILINQQPLTGITKAVPTYRSLLVNYDSLRIRQQAVQVYLQELLTQPRRKSPPFRAWRIPVCYGGSYGIDLETLAALHQLSPQQVIERHIKSLYRVYMIGFMPGFTYLGGLDASLHTPRRDSPRLSVPAGSISIGGMQTAVGSVEAPSGWHLIGKTPFRSFVPEREPAVLLRSGDAVSFYPVSTDEYQSLADQEDYAPEWSWQDAEV